jgi:hypothetical protein
MHSCSVLRSILVPSAFCFLGSLSIAQDTLVYVNGNRIVGTVEEIGLDQVRYHTNSAGNQVAIVVPKSELQRVKLAGGQEIMLSSAQAGSSRMVATHRNAIKLDFLAPALNHFVVGYEHSLKDRMNLEVHAGIIGLGAYGDYRDQHGFMARAGVKFIMRTRRGKTGGFLDEGPLGGFYLRPALMVSAWRRDITYYTGSYPYPVQLAQRSANFTSAALNVEVGRQYVLGQHITFDMYIGLGYGAQWFDQSLVSDVSYYDSRSHTPSSEADHRLQRVQACSSATRSDHFSTSSRIRSRMLCPK